ncbi:hypothetical protein O181_122845 [Austropuccinia psidii MF-1]|uniref:Uncharacterized protein n=1 Tax=Austropuccinia psidii MF-1 TaxID=1389203 RepID=A0A9Q3Q3P2_9BASI|nr:hypothetical protein [Austropuccinia psidii MF-1]
MPFQINSASQSPILMEGISPSVLQSMAATRRPFEDPNSLAFQVLVISFQQYFPQENTGPGFFMKNLQRFPIIQISCEGIKNSSTSWTTQLVHKGVIWTTCMALAHLGQFIFNCGNSRHTVHFSIWQDLY